MNSIDLTYKCRLSKYLNTSMFSYHIKVCHNHYHKHFLIDKYLDGMINNFNQSVRCKLCMLDRKYSINFMHHIQYLEEEYRNNYFHILICKQVNIISHIQLNKPLLSLEQMSLQGIRERISK